MLQIAMMLIQFAPSLAGMFGGTKAEAIAQKVVGIAQTVTGEASPDKAVAAIQADPAVAMAFQKSILENQSELAKMDNAVSLATIRAASDNASAVNATMQAEAKSDHWPTYSWRPFIGFCFGIGWIGDYFILPLVHIFFPPVSVPTIPPEAWIAAGGILGVASFFRGKAQADPGVKIDNRG